MLDWKVIMQIDYNQISNIVTTKSGSKKKDLQATTDTILEQITKIEKGINNNLHHLPINFSEDIEFVDPLFLILLLDLYNKYNQGESSLTLTLDITRMKDNSQKYLHRILTQYFTKNLIDVYFDKSKYDEGFIEQYSTTKKIQLMTSLSSYAEETNRFDKVYFLPIIRLRNFTKKNIDDVIHPDNLSDKDRLEKIYNDLCLEEQSYDVEMYRKNLKNSIVYLLNKINVEDELLVDNLRGIFFELLDNIRKHTNTSANAHISFRKDTFTKEFELIIADNDTKGFLETYKNTLEAEIKRLEDSGILPEVIDPYYDAILEQIKEGDYINVLKGLFLTTEEKDIHMHQIPRVIMHFGFPILVKILSGIEGNKKSTLRIFLHTYGKNFEIQYNFSENNLYVYECHKIKQTGTYIVITFPSDMSYESAEITTKDTLLHGGVLKNDDYSLFLKNNSEMEAYANEFYILSQEELLIARNNSNFNNYRGIVVSYNGENSQTFADFLRRIYLFSFRHGARDFIILNSIGSIEYENYIKFIKEIFYKTDKEEYFKTPPNLLFYRSDSPEIDFVGGSTVEEHYNLSKITTQKKSSENIRNSSNLFYKIEGSLYLFPFELFDIKSVNILETLVNTYLNRTAKQNLHIDTHAGYHIDKFLNFQPLFTDSRWVKRLAFKLTSKIQANDKIKYIIGTDKYVNMLIALVKQYSSGSTNVIEGYKLFDIQTNDDFESIQNEVDSKQENTLVLSSVIFKGEKLNRLNTTHKKVIAQLKIDGKEASIDTLLVVKVEDEENCVHKIDEKEYCGICKQVNLHKMPLLELDKKDPLTLKDIYFDGYTPKTIKSYTHNKPHDVNWFNSLQFGHITRGTNHFLYYIQSVFFYKKNEDKLKEYAGALKSRLNANKNDKQVLLLSPTHKTNNNFIALVNQIVFDNEATVLSFDKSKSEDNFHKLESINLDLNNTQIYFVDDSIASGYTLEYFYNLAKTIQTKQKVEEIGLDGVIVMVDRMSSYDEALICNYFKPKQEGASETNKEERLSHIHAFASLEIKPIKTEVEECFLCKRKDEYIELMKKSALDLTTFQMAKRALKLKETSYEDIEFQKDNLLKQFKTFIKTMAVDYLYKQYSLYVHKENKNENENENEKAYPKLSEYFLEQNPESFESFCKEFENYIMEFIKKYQENELINTYGKNFIEKAVEFEAEVSLLKALSLPKMSYYYKLREWVTWYIFTRLKGEEVGRTINSKFKPTRLIFFAEKNNIKTKEYLRAYVAIQSDSFLKEYLLKTNVNKINLYFTLLGYFKDSRLLDYDFIQLYYKAVVDQVLKDKSQKHIYPFAVKMVVANNYEKAMYLKRGIEKFNAQYINQHKENHKKKWALINALFLENFMAVHNSKIIKTINKIEEDKVGSEDIKLYITPHLSVYFNDYEEYLKASKKDLIDVFNNYESIDSLEKDDLKKSIQDIFYGAVDTQENKEEEVILGVAKDIYKQIDDTWANDYIDGYTIVRLTLPNDSLLFSKDLLDIKKNNNIWFRPIGCFVIKHKTEKKEKKENYIEHLQYVSQVLSYKYKFAPLLEKEFRANTVQEVIEKNLLKQEYKRMLTQIHHSVKDYIDLKPKIDHFLYNEKGTEKEYKEYLERLSIYSWGLKELTSLPSLQKNITEGATYLSNLLDEDTEYIENLKTFIDISKHFTKKLCQKCTKETLEIVYNENYNMQVNFSIENLYTIVFELIFNALKRMKTIENPKIIINLTENNKIKFSNTVADNELLEHVKAINNATTGDNQKMGIGILKSILDKDKITLTAMAQKDNMLEIILSKEINE